MRKFFTIIATIFVVLIAAAIVAPYVISADTLKRPLIEKIQEMTGRTLTVDGAFRLTFFPVAGVSMERVTLSNPAGYGNAPPFITLGSLDAGVALLPLLHKEIEVRRLVLVQPHINLHIDKNGMKNWQFAKAEPVASSTAHGVATASSAMPAPVALPENLSLNDVVLKNGVVAYQDETGKTSWEVDKLNANVALTAIDAPFTLNGDGEWNHKTVKVAATIDSLQKLSQMQAAALEAKITGDFLSLALKGSMSFTDYRGKLTAASPSLKDLLAWANPGQKPLPTPAPVALNISGDAECSKQSCGLTNAKLTLDKIQATGLVKALYGKDTPSLLLDLTTNTLDCNPFLPPVTAKKADNGFWVADAQADPASVWSEEPIDASALKAANLTADIKADGLVWRKITIGKTALHAELKNGRMSVGLIDADLYSGKGTGTIIVDGVASPLTLESHFNLKGVQAAPLLKAAAGTDRISGTADAKLDTTSKGASQKELISALSGGGNFKLTGGALQGIDLANIPQNLAIGLKLSDNPAQKTDISEMGGTFTIAQGVAGNHDLVMNTATLHMSGDGNINLPLFTVNYRLTPQIVRAAQGTKAAQQGVAVPIIIDGSLDSPSFKPDLKSLLQNALKNPKKFRDALKNSSDTLSDQLKNPDAVKKLKGLLNGL